MVRGQRPSSWPSTTRFQEAGDSDRVARLVLDVMNPVWASGRVDTVLRWMEWFEHRNLIERYPAVTVHGALIFALLGRPGRALGGGGRAGLPTGRLSDGSTMEGYLAYLRAILCAGVQEMRRDERTGWDGLGPLSPYRATMLYTEGLSYLLEGDPDRADPIFARAFDAATDLGSAPLAAGVLAERCIVAVGRDDWPAAVALSEQALSMVQDGAFDDYWTSALVYAWAARVIAIHRGDPGAAREHVIEPPACGRCSPTRFGRVRSRPSWSWPAPTSRSPTPTEPGPSSGRCRHPQQRPDLGVLADEADELRAKVETIGRQGVGGSSLTTAELRILPLLATHLTFREIAERLYTVAVHGEDPGPLGLPEVQRVVEERDRARPRRRGARPSVSVGPCPEARPEPTRAMTTAEGRRAWCLSAEASSAPGPDRPAPEPRPRWPMATAVLVATILYVAAPHRGRVPGWWLFPLVQLVLLES